MSYSNYLFNLIIGPLDLLFNLIFREANEKTGSPVLGIVILSLVVNILILPLYIRADKLQIKQAKKESALQNAVKHIKKTFSGEERFMILQTFYRQNNYRPTDALQGFFPLLLQIPFFITAYHMLSNLKCLENYKFGHISNLAAPDAMLSIAGISINVLPILMTGINILSAYIYATGLSKKSKMQMYALALVFLILLYNSPAGLVLYWTFNNVFSLGKNIVYKYVHISPKKKAENTDDKLRKPNTKIFVLSSIYLTLFIGLYIPVTVISSSTSEFVSFDTLVSPMSYILHTLAIAAGAFILWTGFIYILLDGKWKHIFERIVFAVAILCTLQFMVYGKTESTLSEMLIEASHFFYSLSSRIINIIVLTICGIAIFLLVKKYHRICEVVILAAVLVTISYSSYVIFSTIIPETRETINKYSSKENIVEPKIKLTATGKNVMVIMLDRATGSFIPYIFNERPDIEVDLQGFTYYPNTISYAPYTNVATPALFGGYEYTPLRINNRKNKSIIDEQNEALKLMPKIFSDNNYDVSVISPPYAGYEEVPDLSIFDDIKNVKAYYGENLIPTYSYSFEKLNRNLFCYSISRCSPLFFYKIIKNGGVYNDVNEQSESKKNSLRFEKDYQILKSLSSNTIISGDANTFLYLDNETSHSEAELKEPEYEPAPNTDNTAYEEKLNYSREDGKGNIITFSESRQAQLYGTTLAAIKLLGEYFNWMRENDVYDNTRIIVVSDHASDNGLYSQLIDYANDHKVDLNRLNALLMVKDFNSKEFKTDRSFMTNADTPTIATENIIINPVNPYTGKKIQNKKYKQGKQYVQIYGESYEFSNPGNTFNPSGWATVYGDVLNRNSWDILEGEF